MDRGPPRRIEWADKLGRIIKRLCVGRKIRTEKSWVKFSNLCTFEGSNVPWNQFDNTFKIRLRGEVLSSKNGSVKFLSLDDLKRMGLISDLEMSKVQLLFANYFNWMQSFSERKQIFTTFFVNFCYIKNKATKISTSVNTIQAIRTKHTKLTRFDIIFFFRSYCITTTFHTNMEDQVMLIAFHQRLQGKMRF